MTLPEVVTFDFWSTVAIPDVAGTRAVRGAAITEVLERHGARVDAAKMEGVFDAAVELFNEAWAANSQFTGRDAGAYTADHLVANLGATAREEVIEAFVESSRSVSIELAPGAARVLERLQTAGVRLAVICDVGLTPSRILREYLDANGVLGLFDHLSFSDEVGMYKPASEMFSDALVGLGDVEPSRSVHVGDLLRTDIAGARSFGMRSVRYSGVFDDADALADRTIVEADRVVDRHDRLFDVLGSW